MRDLSWTRTFIVAGSTMFLATALGLEMSWKLAAVIMCSAAMTELLLLHQNGHFRR